MLSNWLKINQTTQISRDTSENDWYISRIQDTGKEKFFIDMPYQRSLSLALTKDDRVKVQIFVEGGKIEFKSTVLEIRLDNILLFSLSIPEEYTHVQQRNFVRLPIMMDILYAVKPEEPDSLPQYIKTIALDLSGGGMRISSDMEYPSGTTLLLKFSLEIDKKIHEIFTTGRIIRTFRLDQTDTVNAAVEFIGLRTSQQDLIMRFVIQKMSLSKQLK